MQLTPALIVITLLCVAWSLWIRRTTWSARWEIAATLNIALQGVAVLLMSPLASRTIGPGLHWLTGLWNLEDYIGHAAYLVAASAIVYNAVSRLQDDSTTQHAFTQYIERPTTVCIPLLLVLFSMGSGPKVYRPDFFEASSDAWLRMYWSLLCSTLIYLLGYGTRALLILRKDPKSRWIANVYLLACTSCVTACVIRIVTAWINNAHPLEGGTLVWIFACGCTAGFALASAHSWRIRNKRISRTTH